MHSCAGHFLLYFEDCIKIHYFRKSKKERETNKSKMNPGLDSVVPVLSE